VQQQGSSRLSDGPSRGLALGNSTLRRDSASEATAGLSGAGNFIRDSAFDDYPGLHAAHVDGDSETARAPRLPGHSDSVGSIGLHVPPSRQIPGFTRDSANEEAGPGAGAGSLGLSGRPASAFERAPSMRGAGYVRDSATDETVLLLAAAGRRDSASEQLPAASAEAGPSRLHEVCMLLTPLALIIQALLRALLRYAMTLDGSPL